MKKGNTKDKSNNELKPKSRKGTEIMTTRRNEYTYDVVFNDDTDSNSKGFNSSFDYCKDYIRMYNGTNESYFEDYKGGSVQIVCNETEEVVYEEAVK